MGKLWGGRFEEQMDGWLAEFSSSLRQDRRLWRYDIHGSIAHITMLGQVGLLTSEAVSILIRGLKDLESELVEAEGGRREWPFRSDAEDVHSEIERLLVARVGPQASQMHMGRSRNDQVALDVRLWLRDQVEALQADIMELQRVVLERAETMVDWMMPGLTHFQPAQPISLAHHLLAYFWMWNRDRLRLKDAQARLDECPLGAGALAGSSLPIDRQMVAHQLGFSDVSANSLDTVSSRDQMTEVVFALSQMMIHHSRLCDEIVIWTNPRFGYAQLPDRLSTGSSMMPQKKNPDFAELVRGRSARLIGQLNHLLVVVKGLPLSYNRDLQEDKVALFDAFDTARSCTRVVCAMLESIQFQREAIEGALAGDFSNATELADGLAKLGVPFREAHEVTGRVVRWCISNQRTLESMTAAELKSIDPVIPASFDVECLTHRSAFQSRNSEGGTAPNRVREQIARARAELA